MARNFDGTDDKLVYSDITSVSAFTAVAWASRDTTVTGVDAIFACDNYPTTPRNSFLFQFRSDAGGTYLGQCIVGDTGGDRTEIALPAAGAFGHFAVTRNGTTAKIWSDGTQVGADLTVGSGSFTAENVRVGAHFFSGADNEFFDGDIAEVALFDRDLSSEELVALANGASIHRYSPRHLYSPIFGTGSPEPDHSGNANNGTVTGTTTVDHVRVAPAYGPDVDWLGAFTVAPAAGQMPARTRMVRERAPPRPARARYS